MPPQVLCSPRGGVLSYHLHCHCSIVCFVMSFLFWALPACLSPVAPQLNVSRLLILIRGMEYLGDGGFKKEENGVGLRSWHWVCLHKCVVRKRRKQWGGNKIRQGVQTRENLSHCTQGMGGTRRVGVFPIPISSQRSIIPMISRRRGWMFISLSGSTSTLLCLLGFLVFRNPGPIHQHWHP